MGTQQYETITFDRVFSRTKIPIINLKFDWLQLMVNRKI